MYLELCAGSSGLCSMLKVCAIEEMLIVQVKKKTLFFFKPSLQVTQRAIQMMLSPHTCLLTWPGLAQANSLLGSSPTQLFNHVSWAARGSSTAGIPAPPWPKQNNL